MVTVPTAQNTVGIAELTPAKFQTPDMRGTGLEGFAAGLQALGAGGHELAASLHEIDERLSVVAVKDADNKAVMAANQILDDPDTGYLSLRGQTAHDQYQPTFERLQEAVKAAGGGLTTRRARTAYEQTAGQRLAMWQSSMAHHAMNQAEAMRDDVSDQRVKLNASDAINSVDDPERHERAIGTVIGELRAVGQRMGWTEEQTIGHTAAQVSQVRRQSVLRLTDADEPGAAAAYLKEHTNEFLGQDRAAVETAIRISNDRIEAKARTLAAEQRAQDAHARTQQREGLSAVRVALDTGAGTVADWEKLSAGYAALGDASGAVEARARGVEMGAATKYRGAALPQLDQRITELQGKPSLAVDEAAELKGLRTLREQTASRLGQPGGALAQFNFATGQSIEPLNPNDPNTFARRAALAVTAARTYGRQTVEPLMAADAAPLKDLASSSDPTKRLHALQMIARFGNPLAIEGAARQISSEGDGGFRIAATLMTLPGDAGMQAARDILRGPDAAKTNGAVFLPAEAKRVFEEFAGPALRNMPAGYASDAYTAAWDLYVTRMTQAGKTTWDEGNWRGAINAVTGGYNAHGQHYGGVAYFNDTPVSIPPGWTSDGLFRRLARATDHDWNAAALNGTPMWPDGSAVTHSQINGLAPARVSGTTYGLLTRNGRFLTAKNGGPFLFDAAKVPWR